MKSGDPRRLPARYAQPWRQAFDEHVQPGLTPGAHILDVGSGRKPTLPPELRPSGAQYVGLDLSDEELRRAPAGSYDELHVADVIERMRELEGRFDLIVSWQVLEHVKPLAAAIDNLRSYLRPGGLLVAQMSGKLSPFGLVNAVVPQRVGVAAMKQLLHRDPETVFPAHYDKCTDRGLTQVFGGWSDVEIVPRYHGSSYFEFLPPLHAAYMAYENWICESQHRNLATHYLVAAVK